MNKVTDLLHLSCALLTVILGFGVTCLTPLRYQKSGLLGPVVQSRGLVVDLLEGSIKAINHTRVVTLGGSS